MNNNKNNNPFAVGDERAGEKRFIKNERADWTEEVFINRENTSGNGGDFMSAGITSKKLSLVFVIILSILGILFARSAYLQIIRGGSFADLAEGNRIRIKNVTAERGILFDRDGKPLVENIASFYLYLIPSDLPRDDVERDQVIKSVAGLTDLSKENIKSKLEEVPDFSSQPITLKSNLSHSDAILLNIESMDLPGVEVGTGYLRHYLPLEQDDTHSASHFLGYEGKINEEELASDDSYLITDRVGKTGVEFTYEKYLRGTHGKKRVEIDARGQEKKTIAEIPAKPGNDMILSVDSELQSQSEKILRHYLEEYGKKRGTVIAMDPSNGEILSMVNLPSFNSNDFALGITSEKYNELVNDENKPLFNRAIKGEYASGSTFKPVVAAAALEEGIINKNTSFLSTGGLRIASLWWFPDWKAGGHGLTNVTKALAESVNTFFYIIGGGYEDFSGLGVEKITEYAQKFGLGEKLGIDIPGESKGFLPSKEWKENTKDEMWYIGDTYHYAIGQGDILVTPLQVLGWISTFANDGILYRPHLAKEIIDKDGQIIKKMEPEIINSNFISRENIDIIRQGLREGVLYGSSRRLQSLPVSSAGKTGTAQWHSEKPPHAWFAGFAPYENPEITIVVLIEEGEEGSGIALSVAKDIMNWYFTNR